VPKPCSKPLRQNPFETYRDPVTGQWEVRYPASALPAKACSVQSVSTEAAPVRHLWKKPTSKTKVA